MVFFFVVVVITVWIHRSLFCFVFYFHFVLLVCFSPPPLCSSCVSQSMRSQSLDIENFESGVKISDISDIFCCQFLLYAVFTPLKRRRALFLQDKRRFEPCFSCRCGRSEVQAAVHRIPGHSGEHSGRQGYQTRPMAAQEASGRSVEPSPGGLLPESLENPAEGQSAALRSFQFKARENTPLQIL